MSEFVKLTCPNCSGKLQIGANIQQFACSFCGQEYVVNRGGGIVSVEPLVEGLNRIHRGVDQTASELAIQRLEREIGVLEKEINEDERSISEFETRIEKLQSTNRLHEKYKQQIRFANHSLGVLVTVSLIAATIRLLVGEQANYLVPVWIACAFLSLPAFASIDKAKTEIKKNNTLSSGVDMEKELISLREYIVVHKQSLYEKRAQLTDKRHQLQRHQKIVSGQP